MKLTAPKKKIIKKDPKVNENPIKEEVTEVVEEVLSKEEQFIKGLERIISQQISDGGNRFL